MIPTDLQMAIFEYDPAHSDQVIIPLHELERTMIRAALVKHGLDNKPAAAQALGISLKTLYNRMHAYGWLSGKRLLGRRRRKRSQ